jgi:predicted nucleotidyltransferase
MLPPDFREFLRLLSQREAEYLLISGYAVNYYGYARATADMDVWIAVSPKNAERISAAVREFGFKSADASLFLEAGRIIRFGVPPLRIEVLNRISGVDFEECYASRVEAMIEGIPVTLIDLDHLKANKKAAGRLKDLNDLEQLSPPGPK